MGFEGEEFVGGLLHDFGRVLLAILEPERFSEIDPLDFDETPERLVWEDELIGTDHCRFGAWYAIQQKLPSPIPNVILWHHQPEEAQENQKLVALIAVADHMANHLHRFQVSNGYDPLSNPFVPILAKFSNAPFADQFVAASWELMDKTMRHSQAVTEM